MGIRTLPAFAAIIAAIALGFSALSPAAAPPEEPLSLWYDEPAAEWTEALPVGQGRLGAMVFGGVARERIQFNEDTVWQGAPHDYANKGFHKHLGELRRLLWAGKQSEAEELAMGRFMSIPLGQKAYQAFGDLQIEMLGVDESDVSDYRRDLNLDTAIASVQYRAGHLGYKREVFASFPDKVIVIRLSATGVERLSFRASLVAAHPDASVKAIEEDLVMAGAVPDSAIRFEARLAVQTDGSVEIADGKLVVRSAIAPRCCWRAPRISSSIRMFPPTPPSETQRFSSRLARRATKSCAAITFAITKTCFAAFESIWAQPIQRASPRTNAFAALPPKPTRSSSRCCFSTGAIC